MNEVLTAARVRRCIILRHHPAGLALALAALALCVAAWRLRAQLPPSLWLAAIWHPDPGKIDESIVHYAWLPRLALAWLAGAALAAAGTVFQQVLRNPLAEPATLGTAAGAQFALQLSSVWAPALLNAGRGFVALLGGAVATAAVFIIAAPQRLTPFSVVLAGMAAASFFTAVVTALLLLQDHYLNISGAFIWNSGSLEQQGWQTVQPLLWGAWIMFAVMALIGRPLALFDLGDAAARSLGLWLSGVRLIALTAAVTMTSLVVSAVGVIGFVGLAAPLLARSAGARLLMERLVWAPVIGGAILCLADQLIQFVNADRGLLLPVGAATAMLGGPLMLWQIWHLPAGGERLTTTGASVGRSPVGWPIVTIGICLALPVLMLWLVLCVGQGPSGWHVSTLAELTTLLPWRLPRSLAAMTAGSMLALSGCLMQRLTGNPMAAPDILGINAGAALGVVVAMLWAPAFQMAAAGLGAVATLALVLIMTAWTGAGSERALVVGVVLTTLLSVLTGVVITGGDLQSAALLNWMAGSTYGVSLSSALALSVIGLVLLALMPLLRRWLVILPLGEATTIGLGISSRWAQGGSLLLACVAAAAVTVVVGPLSFVGLLAPHGAALLGLRRPVPHVLGSLLLGGTVMLCADWTGRNAMFPYELPAGLVAALIGAPGFVWLLTRRRLETG